MMEYRFLTRWEEEVMLDNPKSEFKITQESALQNLIGLTRPIEEDEDPNNTTNLGGNEKSKHMYKDKPQTVCGMQKKEVF